MFQLTLELHSKSGFLSAGGVGAGPVGGGAAAGGVPAAAAPPAGVVDGGLGGMLAQSGSLAPGSARASLQHWLNASQSPSS